MQEIDIGHRFFIYDNPPAHREGFYAIRITACNKKISRQRAAPYTVMADSSGSADWVDWRKRKRQNHTFANITGCM